MGMPVLRLFKFIWHHFWGSGVPWFGWRICLRFGWFCEGRPVARLPDCTEDSDFFTFFIFFLWYILIRHKSLISAHDMLVCPCSPPFHSRLRRRHRLNCHILAAIEASNSLTRVQCPFSFWSHSSRVSGCRRFHEDLSGYCPHHQWSRWAKCTDWLLTAPWLGFQLRGNADPTGL